MGWCCSSPSASRGRYKPPSDWDEDAGPTRYFGKYRSGSVLVPDDIDGLPSTFLPSKLASDPNTLLYEAEIDQGYGCRGLRPLYIFLAYFSLFFALFAAILKSLFTKYGMNCDESCQWVRKEYSSRNYFRVYPNRIEVNTPMCRLFGMLGCGSWSKDVTETHQFDRGAFGFRTVHVGVISYLCCLWPVFGSTMARQRCQCNGPLWHGGWWCDEWVCDMCFCSYRYTGLADADEAAFASSLALQAYFENRHITKQDMDKCLEYWRDNISEYTAPQSRKRPVCCEPVCFPFLTLRLPYQYCCTMKRSVPYGDDDPRNTPQIQKAYAEYERLRQKQNHVYKTYTAPVRKSTVCRALGCKRLFGRNGLFFCTEGCSTLCWLCKRDIGDPPPPFEQRDIDDENDASLVICTVLGDPPANVVYKRWIYDEEKNENVLVTYPEKRNKNESLLVDEPSESLDKDHHDKVFGLESGSGSVAQMASGLVDPQGNVELDVGASTKLHDH